MPDKSSLEFYIAIKEGDVITARAKIDERADVNELNLDDNKFTPLHLAINEGQFNIVKLLIEKKRMLRSLMKYLKVPLFTLQLIKATLKSPHF